MKTPRFFYPPLWAAISVALSGISFGQASISRGLWVGEVVLDRAVEVTVPIDENNVPIGPDPDTPTKTFDKASLRIIVHVNGAGQVSLLKDVAVLSRVAPGADGVAALSNDLDLALVTDSSLFAEFPPQPARRFASAVFDFGDSEAIKAVDAIAFVAAEAAARSADAGGDLAAATQAGLDAVSTAQVESLADSTATFDNFMRTLLNRGVINGLTFPNGTVSAAINTEAQRLANGVATNDVLGRPISLLQDSRAQEMLAAVLAAPDVASAQNVAAGYADLDDGFGRFLAGAGFQVSAGPPAVNGNITSMIADAAAAGAAAKLAGDDVGDAVRGGPGGSPAPAPSVTAAQTEALRVQVALYDDTRASSAVTILLDAIAAAGTAATTTSLSELERLMTTAGEQALAAIPRSPAAATNPSPTYTAFVKSGAEFNATEKYSGAAATAAAAAAAAAVKEKLNPLGSLETIRAQAFLAAVDSLRFVYRAAARAIRHEQPLDGKLEPGETVTGAIMLPANHPTNPFRHRRHPDHTTGRNIERHLTLEVDGDANDSLRRVGYGVDRVTGEYTEEIFGLHKPLGPNKDKGLKVAGRFELNRISLIDALNAK